jgi:hypothetical protein
VRVVDAEVPAPVVLPSVLLDERVLLRGGGLVLAPVVAVVEDHPCLCLDELLGVLVGTPAQLDGHVAADRPARALGQLAGPARQLQQQQVVGVVLIDVQQREDLA